MTRTRSQVSCMSLGLDSIARRLRAGGENAAMLARLARDLPRALRNPSSPQEARERLRRRLVTREQRLLAIVERAIYGYPRSPYLRLLRHVGSELGDFPALLAREGRRGPDPSVSRS